MGKAAILLTNLLTTWFLLGLIWTVQAVHYPLMARVGPAQWAQYHADHIRIITVLIAPMMFVEALSAAALVFVARGFSPAAKACVWAAAGLVLVNWLWTIGIVVPLHDKLAAAFDPDGVSKLVLTNWVRTIAWTLRGGLMAFVAWQAWASKHFLQKAG